jgi:hypothetical protein
MSIIGASDNVGAPSRQNSTHVGDLRLVQVLLSQKLAEARVAKHVAISITLQPPAGTNDEAPKRI